MKTGYNFLNVMDLRLSRFVSTDMDHIAKYPLSAAPGVKPAPVVAGVNWYQSFYTPVKKGREYWITGQLGPLRGGHCV